MGVVLALSLTGCTDEPPEDPDPPPVVEEDEAAPQLGAELVVVLPPRTTLAPEVAAAITADLARLEDVYDPDLRRVRTRFPDESVFVRDVAALDARDGVDLLCILGSVGRQLGPDLRELHPATRFCATTPNDLPEETEDGIDVVALRMGELGHLLGSSVVRLAGEDGVVLALGRTELQRGRFTEGLHAALGATPVLELDDELAADHAIAAAVAEGGAVVVIGTGPDAAVQTEAAIQAGAHVITHASLVDADDGVALTWNLRWDLALTPAVDRLFGRHAFSELEVGLADGVFELALGPAAPDGLEAQLAGVEEEILEGERDPFEVIEPDEPDEPEEPDEEPGEQPDEEPDEASEDEEQG